MEKQKISQSDLAFLKQELNKHKSRGIISEKQVDTIIESYQVNGSISFIKVLVTVGSILMGLGILSLIASNWIYMGKVFKFSLIIIAYLVTQWISFRIREHYPKTSRSLTYLGVLIFGAGIFLIGQMFNFGGRFTNAFFMWALGIFPLLIYLKDQWMFTFLHLLLLVYLNGQFVYGSIPFSLFLIIPILYRLQRYFTLKENLFLTNIITLNFIWLLLAEGFHVKTELILIIFFVIGLLMYFFPISYYPKIFQTQGNILFGVTGVILTLDWIWKDFDFVQALHLPNYFSIHILFAIFYFLLLLSLVRKNNLFALLFIGITILRFYFDAMYDFLPKSIFFFTGGILLLGFGFYFERKRKELGREPR
ncbi:DUF2157 domain-containing protein [Tepidibacillus fermentans]|uniref:Putative membrane protein n=1 Tax=Tepidibacillus fermentans TaxID=1281767 RepID=A0A4R3KJJ4_9BACI|nr:DUF2157 domain-containing protein [Tepidibacillus fermentans]TCS83848.1 putative membrane protein [Tepidibacillus fermentans]